MWMRNADMGQERMGKPEDGAQEEMVRIASVEVKKEWGHCREEIGQEGFRISASTPSL